MDRIERLENSVKHLDSRVKGLRRLVVGLVSILVLIGLIGATTDTHLNGDVSVSGLLKCIGLKVDGPVDVSKALNVNGDIKAIGSVTGKNIEETAKLVETLGTRVTNLEGKTSDLVRVEVFRLEPDYGRSGRSPGRIQSTTRFNLARSEWKLLAAFPTIQSPGFMKNIWADGHPRGDWAAGATTVFQCDVIEDGDSFLLKYGARWYDWGDDGDYHVRIRFVAVFARR